MRPVIKAPERSPSLPQRATVISSLLQWGSCVLLSERSRRNALAQEPETSWIPECGALQESPESPTWTRSRFPWQRRTNRRKHWGNPVILQHWAIINTQSGEGSRSWYARNPYRARGKRTWAQNQRSSGSGCELFQKSREFTHSCRHSLEFSPRIFTFLFILILVFFARGNPFILTDGNYLFFSFFVCLFIFSQCLGRLGDWLSTTPWGRWIKVLQKCCDYLVINPFAF